MKNYKFGKRSNDNIKKAVKDLALVLHESLKHSDLDFGVSQTDRTIEKQQHYFDTKKSKINPKKYTFEELLKVAKHIVHPELEPLARAADIYAYISGNKKEAFSTHNLAFLAGVITSTANRLYSEGKITHLIRWGGNWDKDGEIITDQRFQDLPHFETYIPKN